MLGLFPNCDIDGVRGERQKLVAGLLKETGKARQAEHAVADGEGSGAAQRTLEQFVALRGLLCQGVA